MIFFERQAIGIQVNDVRGKDEIIIRPTLRVFLLHASSCFCLLIDIMNIHHPSVTYTSIVILFFYFYLFFTVHFGTRYHLNVSKLDI